MNNFFLKSLSFFSFIFIPIFFLWHPNWLGLLRIQPYWPLFWLLPWSMIHGSINGLFVGLFLGITLDALTLDSYTQIPGLILCGIWFGQFRISKNLWVGHFRFGLLCSIGSFVCGTLYIIQILIRNLSDNNFLFFLTSIQNILAQILLTGLLAPLLCSNLLRIFNRYKNKNILINLKNK